MDEPLTPVIEESKPITMSFPDAIRLLINGKRIRRISWPTVADYGLLKDGWLMIFTKGDFHTWTVSDGDLEGQDWIVLPDLN